MHSLLYRLFAVLSILSIKQVTPIRAAITNEEHIDEGEKRHACNYCVYQRFSCIVSCSSDYGYYGGDIILTEQQKEMLEGSKNEQTLEGAVDGDEAHSVNRRAVVKNSNYLWPNGIVPYVLDSSLSK